MLEPSWNHLPTKPRLCCLTLFCQLPAWPEQNIPTRRVFQTAICLSASPRTDWKHWGLSSIVTLPVAKTWSVSLLDRGDQSKKPALHLTPWGFVGTVCKHLPLATHSPCMFWPTKYLYHKSANLGPKQIILGQPFSIVSAIFNARSTSINFWPSCSACIKASRSSSASFRAAAICWSAQYICCRRKCAMETSRREISWLIFDSLDL